MLSALIHDRLQQAFSPEFLDIIDDSAQHVGHAGSAGGAGHYTVVITAAALKNKPRVEAHRAVYTLLADLMPYPLHALQIKIK